MGTINLQTGYWRGLLQEGCVLGETGSAGAPIPNEHFNGLHRRLPFQNATQNNFVAAEILRALPVSVKPSVPSHIQEILRILICLHPFSEVLACLLRS